MKISTKTEYGLRLMLELAIRQDKSPVLLKDIAENQDLPEKYLSNIAILLKSGGLINSIRGAKGGYVLSRPSDRIKISEIFNITEGGMKLIRKNNVGMDKLKPIETICMGVWRDLEKTIEQNLNKITLENLAENYNKKEKTINYII